MLNAAIWLWPKPGDVKLNCTVFGGASLTEAPVGMRTTELAVPRSISPTPPPAYLEGNSSPTAYLKGNCSSTAHLEWNCSSSAYLERNPRRQPRNRCRWRQFAACRGCPNHCSLANWPQSCRRNQGPDSQTMSSSWPGPPDGTYFC